MKYILLVVVCITVLYGCFIFKKTKDLLNPILAFALPILVSVIINLIFYDGKGYRISSYTYAIYLLGVVSFTAGCFLMVRSVDAFDRSTVVPLKINPVVFNICKLLATMGTLVSLIYIYNILRADTFGHNFIQKIRWYGLNEQENYLIGKYSRIFIEIIFCVYAYKYFVLNQKDKRNRNCLLFYTIQYGIAIMTTMARTAILQFVLELIYIFLLGMRYKSSSEKKKLCFNIVLFGILVVFAMQYLAIRTERASYVVELTGETVNWMIPYFGKTFYIFDYYILPHSGVTKGINSFGFFGRLLNKMGILMPKYTISIPEGWVASFITDPYTDFGIAGVCIVMLINGVLIGIIYRMAMKHLGWWLILYSVCLYSCIMAFFAFQFTMSSQLYFAVVAIAVTFDKKHLFFVKSKKT